MITPCTSTTHLHSQSIILIIERIWLYTGIIIAMQASIHNIYTHYKFCYMLMVSQSFRCSAGDCTHGPIHFRRRATCRKTQPKDKILSHLYTPIITIVRKWQPRKIKVMYTGNHFQYSRRWTCMKNSASVLEKPPQYTPPFLLKDFPTGQSTSQPGYGL